MSTIIWWIWVTAVPCSLLLVGLRRRGPHGPITRAWKRQARFDREMAKAIAKVTGTELASSWGSAIATRPPDSRGNAQPCHFTSTAVSGAPSRAWTSRGASSTTASTLRRWRLITEGVPQPVKLVEKKTGGPHDSAPMRRR